MKAVMRSVLSLSLAAVSLAGAIELSDLSPTMTRTQADSTLSKDYKSRVLTDLTVRRVWNLDDNRKLSVDFNPGTDRMICMMVDYRKGVPTKNASADMRKLVNAESKISWKKMSRDKAEKYGVKNAKAAKTDNAYLFMECDKNGKCIRITAFTEKPSNSRVALKDIDPNSDGKTALGNSNRGSAGKLLIQDEQRRFSTPLSTTKPDKPAKPTVTDTADDDEDEFDEIEDMLQERKHSREASISVTRSKTTTVVQEGNSPLKALDEFLEPYGVERNTFLMAAGGGLLGIILLFTLIGMMRRRSAAKRMKAQAEMLRNGGVDLKKKN